MTDAIEVTVWVAYNTDGDSFASNDGASEALEGLNDNYGIADGCRVVEMNLTVPAIKPVAVSGTVPDTDGPVTLTIA